MQRFEFGCAICLAALCLALPSGATVCNSATAAVMEVVIDGLLKPATPILNVAWPAIVDAAKLDPFTAVKDLDYTIGGSAKKACKAVCGAHAASCHKFKLHLGSAVVHNLKDLKWGDLSVENISLSDKSAQDLTSCDMEVDAVAGASASLKVDLDLRSNGGGLRVWCKNAFKKWSELLWKGHGKCTGSTQHATANLKLQGSSCQQPASRDYVAISTTKVESVHFNLDSLSCSFDAGSGVPYLPEIVDFFAPKLFSSIVKDLEPAVAHALTDALDGVLPQAGIPETCNPRTAATANHSASIVI